MRGSALTDSLLAKATIVLSLSVAWIMVMLLPLDVRNAQAFSGDTNLDMHSFWKAMYIMAALFLFFIIPLAMFYHEVEDDESKAGKIKSVLCQLGVTLFIILLLVVVMFFLFGKAKIPYKMYSVELGQYGTENPRASHLTVSVSFDIFIMAFLCFVGWLIFVVFGGIGLSALPIQMIQSFIDRPKPIDISTYAQKKAEYGETATALLDKAKELKEKDDEISAKGNSWNIRRQKQTLKTEYNKLKQTSFMLEEQFENLEIAMKLKGENPLLSYSKLILGILVALISFTWWLHVIIFVLANGKSGPPFGFLNTMLTAMQEGANGSKSPAFILAIVFYSLFNIHLLVCVIAGILKLGMRLFCLPIHPMVVAKTPLNSYLFNCIFILFASCAITQFSQYCLADYSRLSTAASFFQGPIRYLTFFSFFNDNLVFFYIFVIISILAGIGAFVQPRPMPGLNLDGKAESAFKSVRGRMKKELVKGMMG